MIETLLLLALIIGSLMFAAWFAWMTFRGLVWLALWPWRIFRQAREVRRLGELQRELSGQK